MLDLMADGIIISSHVVIVFLLVILMIIVYCAWVIFLLTDTLSILIVSLRGIASGNTDCSVRSSSSNSNLIDISDRFLFIESVVLCVVTITSITLYYFYFGHLMKQYNYQKAIRTAAAILNIMKKKKWSKFLMYSLLLSWIILLIVTTHLYIVFNWHYDCGHVMMFNLETGLIISLILQIVLTIMTVITYIYSNHTHEMFVNNISDSMASILSVNVESDESAESLLALSTYYQNSAEAMQIVIFWLFVFWFTISMVATSLAGVFLFDFTQMNDIINGDNSCDNYTILNGRNVYVCRAEAVTACLLLISLLPIMRLGSLKHQIINDGWGFVLLFWRFIVKLCIFYHLWYLFDYIANCSYYNIIPQLFLLGIFYLVVISLLIIYMTLKRRQSARMRHKAEFWDKQNLSIYMIDGCESKARFVVIYWILQLSGITLITFLVGIVIVQILLVVAGENNITSLRIVACNSEINNGSAKMSRYFVMIVSILTAIMSLILYDSLVVNAHSFISKIVLKPVYWVWQRHWKELMMWIILIVIQAILNTQQISYWYDLASNSNCTSNICSYLNATDVRNIFIVTNVNIIIIVISVILAFGESNSVRNSALQLYLKRAKEYAKDMFDPCRQYGTCQIYSLLILWMMQLLLFISFIIFGFFIAILPIALASIKHENVENVNPSFASLLNINKYVISKGNGITVTALTFECIFLFVVTIFVSRFAFQWFQSKIDGEKHDACVFTLFYGVQVVISAHLFILFQFGAIKCDSLTWNEFDLSHLIVIWYVVTLSVS